jgi:hypothetical protein
VDQIAAIKTMKETFKSKELAELRAKLEDQWEARQ